ncbi:MAG: methyltransferase [Candidatus Pacebacteria bacterium]|nr:methyltransferase [Candidatus Paceibacterota bacterium]
MKQELFESSKIANEKIEERHDLEQYFFSQETAQEMFNIFIRRSLSENKECCFLCCPVLAEIAEKEGFEKNTTLLNIDERFNKLKSYRKFDISADKIDTELEKQFDMIICNPPFFGIEPNQLGKTVESLLKNEGEAYIVFLKRKTEEFYSAMEKLGFNVEKLKFKLDYKTIKDPINRIALYKLKMKNKDD